jgi:Zn-dependent peptidase ImmA (M78 family)/transcriptional regulator with XRE-family HTH domain
MPLVPERLTLARQLRGDTKRAIARGLDVSEALVGQWESGVRAPSDDVVRRLAQRFAVPEAFFAEGTSIEVDHEAVSFRSLKTITRADRDRACAGAQVAALISQWVAARYTLPTVQLPEVDDAPPAVAAAEVRRAWRLGHDPLPNTLALLEASGVRCFALGEALPKADALSVWVDGVPLVLFNTEKSAERSRNDACHELGHLVLHRHRRPVGEDAETEANAFAAELLLPRESILRQAPRVLTLSELLRFKRAWGVSAAMMLKRLTDLHLVSEWSARSMWQQLAMNGYRSGEPNGRPREHSQVLWQVYSHLQQQRRGRPFATIAQELRLATSDVRRHIQGLLPIEVEDGGASESSSPPSGANGRPDLKLVL